MCRNSRTQRRQAALTGSPASSFRVPRKLASACLCGVLLSSAPALFADYLSDLDAEVKKVEARQIDGESGTSTVEAPAEVSAENGQGRDGATRDGFEALLKENYLGTFGFYKKLPERSRQEIYAEYRDGAPMSEVRKKIIDRLLQR